MTFTRFLPRRGRLLACTALTALAIATPAAADPVSAVIVGGLSAIGVTATVAAVNSFLISTALSVGLSMASNALRKGSAANATQDRQASITTINVGESPREFLFGRACTAGSLIDGFNYGGQYGTDWECLVIALASHEVDALEGYWVYDRYYSFAANGMQSWSAGGLDIQFVNATPGGSAPPARFAAAAGWASTDRCAGETIIWFAYSAKFVEAQGGRPQPRFVLRGKRLYDPRKDSTVPGGSGAHRWPDPTTYEWSENLEVARYNWERGIYAGDMVTQPQHLWVGRGLSAVEAPPQAIFAAANVCDENVALKAGGTQKRYHGAGVIRSDEDFASVEEMFANCMGGIVIQRAGGVLVEPGAAKAVALEITDEDLVTGTEVTFDSFLPTPERVNTVVSRYIEPLQRWNDHSAPVRRSVVDIQTDGRPNEAQAPLGLVTNGVRAQRIGEIRRRLGRMERRASITLGPRFAALEEGDWIGWTSNRYHNGGRVVYRVDQFARQASWRKTLRLREVGASAFSWVAASDEITPGAALPPEPTSLTPVALAGVTLQGISKNGAPAIRATYATPVDPAVEGVRLEVRQLGQAEATPTMTRDLSGAIETTSGVAPDSSLQVRLLPMTAPHRATAVVPWTTLASAELIAGKIVNQGPGATDPRPPEDIGYQKSFSAKRTYGGFGSLDPYSFGDMTGTKPVNDSQVRLTPTGPSPYFQINAVNREGADSYVIRVRLRVTAPITAAQWKGTVLYSTPGHPVNNSWRKDIPFPAGGFLLNKWKIIEFDMSDLTSGDDDFVNSAIVAARLYLQTADGPPIDLDYVSFGTRDVDPLDLRGVQDNADPTGSNTAAAIQGQGPLATQAAARASQVLVFGDGLIKDKDFADDDYWTLSSAARGVSILRSGSVLDPANLNARGAAQITAQGTTNQAPGSIYNEAYFVVEPGQTCVAEMASRLTSGFNGLWSPRVYWYAADGSAASPPFTTIFSEDYRTSPVVGSAYRLNQRSAPFRAPAGATRGRMFPNFVTWPQGGAPSAGVAYVANPDVKPVAVLGRSATRQDGLTPLSDADAVTAIGTAMAYMGQTAWGTFGASTNRVQYIDDTGRVIDARGLPLNAGSGNSVVLTPRAPLSPGATPSTQIAVAAVTATFPGLTLSMPSATISGLTAGTTYAVFRDLQTSTYVAISSGVGPYLTSPARYLYIGTQETQLSGGGYSPPPPPPPGGGGGLCPAPEVPVLLANADRSGPGREVPAGEVTDQDWLWTMHEHHLGWGAYRVLKVRRHEDEERRELVMQDGRRMVVGADHKMHNTTLGWSYVSPMRKGDAISGLVPGTVERVLKAERGPVIQFLIEDAHTLITAGLLSHNKIPLE